MYKKILFILDKKQKIELIGLLILIIIGAFMEMIGVSAILPLITALMDPDSLDSYTIIVSFKDRLGFTNRDICFWLVIMLAAIYVIKNIYLLIMYNFQYEYIYKNQEKLATKLMRYYVHQPYLYHTEHNVAELHRNVMGDVEQTFRLIISVVQLCSELFTCLLLVIYLLFTDFKSTIMISGLLVISLGVFSLIYKRIQEILGEQFRVSVAEMNKYVLQTFGGILEIKILNKERYFVDNFKSGYHRYAKIGKRNQMRGVIPRPIMEAISMCAILTMLGIKLKSGESMSSFIPMLGIFAATAVRILPAFNRVSNYVSIITYIKPSLDNIFCVMNDENIDYPKTENTSKKNKYKMSNELQINNLTFAYDNKGINILNDITLRIKRNESVAFIGASGSGKSTLINLILGVLTPDQGDICVDGESIYNDIVSWHNTLGYIPQSIYLMDDTIERNIAFGIRDDQIDHDRVMQVIEEAQLLEFVEKLDKGIYTVVGDRGVLLSGGQRQRLGIARALYRNPDVLVLDEATSALDNETEKAVMQAINSQKGRRTQLIVAHRYTTIRDCDRIYEISDGRIIERNYNELSEEESK